MKRTVDNCGMIFSTVNILLALSFLLFPIIVSIIMSFDGRSYLGLFPPPEYSLRWYENFFSDTYYLKGLKTSLIIAVIATVISTTFGVSAAIGYSEKINGLYSSVHLPYRGYHQSFKRTNLVFN